ncbi:MAG: hypothetical protein ACI4ML_01940 [Aristaeellaceae bacterium]
MEAVFDFLRAALPWVAVGLALAVLCVRGAGRKKDDGQERAEHYGTEGMSLGLCFGTAIGTSLGNNTGLGMCLGMLIGLAIGTSIRKKRRDQDHDDGD